MAHFIALPIPLEIRKFIQKLPFKIEGAKREVCEDLHITLKHSIKADKPLINKLICSLKEIKSEPLSLEVTRLQTFPHQPTNRPQILHLAIKEDPKLILLRDRIDQTCIKHGFAPNIEPFFPHITLYRLPKRVSAEAIEDVCKIHHSVNMPPFTANRFCLYDSPPIMRAILGPNYKTIADFELNI
jgi:2'-5' RNA ligase